MTYNIGMDLVDFVLLVCIILILLTLFSIWFFICKPRGLESEIGSQEIIEIIEGRLC